MWEAKFAKVPILPFDIWKAPSFGCMIVSAFFTCMAVGIILWCASLWSLYLRHYSLFLNAAAYATLAVCGAIAAILSAIATRHLAAQYTMVIASLASAAALVLVCTRPEQQTYWAQMLPALILTALGPDFLFIASQIIASNTVKRNRQGIAGSVIGTIPSYDLSTGLGFGESCPCLWLFQLTLASCASSNRQAVRYCYSRTYRRPPPGWMASWATGEGIGLHSACASAPIGPFLVGKSSDRPAPQEAVIIPGRGRWRSQGGSNEGPSKSPTPPPKQAYLQASGTSMLKDRAFCSSFRQESRRGRSHRLREGAGAAPNQRTRAAGK
ncbi:hypothetical protein LY76DRAFT_674885 [Colletotrichum caudatum]|nr:hypothetical protein LY76DRAFT_674885 [Colletotrichum caudatum]